MLRKKWRLVTNLVFCEKCVWRKNVCLKKMMFVEKIGCEKKLMFGAKKCCLEENVWCEDCVLREKMCFGENLCV